MTDTGAGPLRNEATMPVGIGQRAALDVLADVLDLPAGVLGALPRDLGLGVLAGRRASVALEVRQPLDVVGARSTRGRILEDERGSRAPAA